jgi:hypothetical protein
MDRAILYKSPIILEGGRVYYIAQIEAKVGEDKEGGDDD